MSEQNELLLNILNTTLYTQLIVADMAIYFSYLIFINSFLVMTLVTLMLYNEVQQVITDNDENESIKNAEYDKINNI